MHAVKVVRRLGRHQVGGQERPRPSSHHVTRSQIRVEQGGRGWAGHQPRWWSQGLPADAKPSPNAFYGDVAAQQACQAFMAAVVTRVNTITGVAYK